MLYYCSVETSGNNCGIIEIDNFKNHKTYNNELGYEELNKDRLDYIVKTRIDSIIDGDSKNILSCYIIASLNDFQVEKGYHKDLDKLGFKLLDSTLNSNSGHNIYIYGMKYYRELDDDEEDDY